MPNYSPEQAIAVTSAWIKNFVVRLELCPFAAQPFNNGKIQFSVCESNNELEKRMHLFELVLKLNRVGGNEISNAFMIYTGDVTFDSCLAIREDVLELVGHYDLQEQFQLIVFHPHFQFAEGRGSSSNRVNQSPLPMMHILRQSELNDAIVHIGSVEKIIERNDRKLGSLDFDDTN